MLVPTQYGVACLFSQFFSILEFALVLQEKRALQLMASNLKAGGGAVDDEQAISTELDAAHLEFERLDGELDAAIVFAAAADEACRVGNYEFGATCLTDAKDCYAKVLDVLRTADLTGTQLQELTVKLLRLRRLLGDVATPATNVAA